MATSVLQSGPFMELLTDKAFLRGQRVARRRRERKPLPQRETPRLPLYREITIRMRAEVADAFELLEEIALRAVRQKQGKAADAWAKDWRGQIIEAAYVVDHVPATFGGMKLAELVQLRSAGFSLRDLEKIAAVRRKKAGIE